MALSNEDSLRLNVLLAQDVRAIRIDEGKLVLYALTQKGEAKIQLNPNTRNHKYIKEVKDFLSTKALGVSGGFPMFLSRWNRMGDVQSNRLDKLLLLGEEEAVTAVVNNRDLTADLAKSAWWAVQSSENARSMLANKVVAEGEIGKELAKFLIEFLPFEEEPLDMMTSARLVLQEGLISEEEVLSLWRKAKSKNTLYVGFLDVRPDNLPEPVAEHPRYEEVKQALSEQLKAANPYAEVLCKLLSSQGQTFLKTADASFKRPPNYDVVGALIESIRRYLFIKQPEAGQNQQHHEQGLDLNGEIQTDINKILELADNIANESNGICCSDELKAVREAVPDFADHLQAIVFLGRTTQTVLAPTIAKSTAVGSLMRKKLKPVFDPIQMNLRILSS